MFKFLRDTFGDQPKPKPDKLVFKDGWAFLEYQCRYGHVDLKANHTIVAVVKSVHDSQKYGPPGKAVPGWAQSALVVVASEDGGFVSAAVTDGPGQSMVLGESVRPLAVGDVVLFVPTGIDQETAKQFGDKRDPREAVFGRIVARIKPELSTAHSEFIPDCIYKQ